MKQKPKTYREVVEERLEFSNKQRDQNLKSIKYLVAEETEIYGSMLEQLITSLKYYEGQVHTYTELLEDFSFEDRIRENYDKD